MHPVMNNADNPSVKRVRVIVFLRNVWRAMRPEQWSKNLVVAAPFFFALGDRTQSVSPGLMLRSVNAALLFCLLSGGVYLFNDLLDIDADRRHPRKCRRPLAAGDLSLRAAWTTAAVLMLTALGLGWLIALPLAFFMTLYLALQFGYTIRFKHVPLLDIVVVATGFVLRALAGAVAVDVVISPWLVVCTFLLAAFLGLCKRRHEKIRIDDGSLSGSRASLAGYHRDSLDRLVIAVATAVVLAYAGYALAPETARKFGDRRLLATLPFVVFGVARYLVLVFRRNMGDRPERILVRDVPTLLNLALYSVAVFWLTLLLP